MFFDHIKTGITSAQALGISMAVLVIELVLIGAIFKHGLEFHCVDNWPEWICSASGSVMVAIFCATGALIVGIMLRPAQFKTLFEGDAGPSYWLLLNLVGVAIAIIPAFLLKQGGNGGMIAPTLLLWTTGVGAMLCGLFFFTASIERWVHFLRGNWKIAVPVTAIGLATPIFATLIRPIWRSVSVIADLTFNAVSTITQYLGYDVEIYPDEKVIGAGDFFINIAPVCSGIEGMALITVFLSIYLYLFRDELRFPIAFILYPIGILAASILNVIRISVLLIFGLEGNPELAVGGFHSHAGWLMFTVISIGLIALAQTVTVLQKTPETKPTPTEAFPAFREDPIAACILPFAVFMFSALLVSTFANVPALAYPFRALAMFGILAVFWPFLSKMKFQLDYPALLIGVVIGLVWVSAPVESKAPPYGELSGGLLILWMLTRGVGTVLLVPIIEELFFRKYLERRLRLGQGNLWRIAAAILIACMFAFLHDRWLLAFVASLLFSYVMARRERVEDAITSHATANAVVFACAWITGELALI